MENRAFEQGRRKLAEWQRGGPERLIAGVCASMSRQLNFPLPVVRALFLVATVVPSTRSAAVLLYLALWFLTPPEPGEPSGLERVVNAVSSFGFGARRSENGAGEGGYGAEGGRGYGAADGRGYGGPPYGASDGGAAGGGAGSGGGSGAAGGGAAGGRIGTADGAEGEAGAAER